MRQNCKNKCTISLITLKGTTLYAFIDSFISQNDVFSDETILISEFYQIVKKKYNIPCESGMLFIEKLVMYNLYNKFRINHDSTNTLVNEKVLLYQWIKPEHLGIINTNVKKCVSEFKEISKSDIPSVKIYYLMKAIANLYEVIGKESTYDSFFSALIFCLIKSKTRDIYIHIKFMKAFRRKYGGDCTINCCHGFNINVSCDCLISKNWNDEDKYYLVTSEAAVEYIRKMEYYNLKIKVTEFEKEITEKIEDLNLKEKPDSFEDYFES